MHTDETNPWTLIIEMGLSFWFDYMYPFQRDLMNINDGFVLLDPTSITLPIHRQCC